MKINCLISVPIIAIAVLVPFWAAIVVHAETNAESVAIEDTTTVKILPVAKIEAAPEPGSTRAVGQSLFKALLDNINPDSTEPFLKAALERGARPCHQISTWQVYRLTNTSRTLKIKCASMNLYAVSVSKNGEMQYSGGDGSIAPMTPSDGKVISIFGQRAEDYLHTVTGTLATPTNPRVLKPELANGEPAAHISLDNSVSGTDNASIAEVPLAIPAAKPIVVAAEPVATEKPASPGILSLWLLSIIAFNILLVGGIGWFIARHLKSARVNSDAGMAFGRDPQWGLSSDDKDYMLDESHELYPNIFSHPRGFFIARGKRGKRRLFRYAFTAMLYRDFGLKIAEIDSD